MTNHQSSDTTCSREHDSEQNPNVRAQCATPSPPTLPSLPAHPNYNPQSPTARTNGSADAREKPPAQAALNDDESRWLAGYRIDRIAGTALILGFKPPITDLLRRKRWAVLIAGEGWAIPIGYLAHVERLLAGADMDLFDVEGAPTPGQRERERRDDRSATAAVLADLHAARDAAEADRGRIAEARQEARAAFARAIANKHPDHDDEAPPIGTAPAVPPVGGAVPEPDRSQK